MQSNVDRLNIQKLQGLDFWPGPISIEPLAGGITNYNYLVKTDIRDYVARLCVEREVLGIDRRNEVLCQRAAHALGIAPAVVHHEQGILISEYIPARALAPVDVRDHEFVRRLGVVLRTLHNGWDRLTGEMLYFSAFQTVRTYAKTSSELGARLPDDMDALLDDARDLSHRLGPFTPVLCHNDLLPANILDDGRRIAIVDWEYAGIGHPLFDMAGVSANCALTEPLECAFLAAYRGEETGIIDPRDLRDLRILKAMSLLREALWSVIQTVASDIAFDYESYAADNFQIYRAARRELDQA